MSAQCPPNINVWPINSQQNPKSSTYSLSLLHSGSMFSQLINVFSSPVALLCQQQQSCIGRTLIKPWCCPIIEQRLRRSRIGKTLVNHWLSIIERRFRSNLWHNFVIIPEHTRRPPEVPKMTKVWESRFFWNQNWHSSKADKFPGQEGRGQFRHWPYLPCCATYRRFLSLASLADLRA